MLYLCHWRRAGAYRVGRNRRSHFLFGLLTLKSFLISNNYNKGVVMDFLAMCWPCALLLISLAVIFTVHPTRVHWLFYLYFLLYIISLFLLVFQYSNLTLCTCRRCDGRKVQPKHGITVGGRRTALYGTRKSDPGDHAESSQPRQREQVRCQLAIAGGPARLGGPHLDRGVHGRQQRRRCSVFAVA